LDNVYDYKVSKLLFYLPAALTKYSSSPFL